MKEITKAVVTKHHNRFFVGECKMNNIKRIEIKTETGTIVDSTKEFVKVDGDKLFLSYNNAPVKSVTVAWNNTYFDAATILGDTWERAYNNLEWKLMDSACKMPWYFLACTNGKTYAFGVKTLPNSLCYWKCDKDEIILVMNIQCGNKGTSLKGRELELCEVVFAEYDKDPFRAAIEFCKLMCDAPRLPKRPVFGGNDWYCNYGNNSYDKILTHTKRIVECTKGCAYAPYMVIDDGWQICHHPSDIDENYYNGGPWQYPNSAFGDMHAMAEAIKGEGAIPGLWFRPLWTIEKLPEDILLCTRGNTSVIDPSTEGGLEKIKDDLRTFAKWGYKLIKFDFSMYDLFGCWGFQLDEPMASCTFHDNSRTTAEIVKGMYSAMREAVGEDVLLMGCNTFSHLSTGFVDISRTGDDTSGKDWSRTKAYGTNTLAFRMSHHRTFYFADADCVGVTNAIPWEKNKQWLDVVAKSGTPLFVSLADDIDFDKIKNDLEGAFQKASEDAPVSIPTDWMEDNHPTQWQSEYGTDKYNW